MLGEKMKAKGTENHYFIRSYMRRAANIKKRRILPNGKCKMVNKLCSLCLHVHTAHTSKHRPNKLWQLHIFLFHFARHLPATIGVCELFFPLSLRLGVCSFVAQNLRQYELILAACHYKFLFCNGKTVFVTPKQKKKRKKVVVLFTQFVLLVVV